MKKVQGAIRLALILAAFYGAIAMTSEISGDIVRYVRYSLNGETHYGIEGGGRVNELDGPPWINGVQTGDSHLLSDVTILAPSGLQSLAA